MAKTSTAIGMLLLAGAVFLSLNALAVSARPGDASQAEKTTSIASANAAMPQVAGSGTAPMAGLLLVPLPMPATNPTAHNSDRTVAMRPTTTPIGGPTMAPNPGITPPTASVSQGGSLAVGSGTYRTSPSAASPVVPGSGILHPVVTPVPIPPVTPQPAKPGPVPVPPYSVDPAREGL